jgi:fatty-acyl-CoA synthase
MSQEIHTAAPAAPTLSGLLRHACDSSAAPALYYGERIVSFAELDAESRRVARGFADLGIGPGDRVALWLPNVPAWLACFFACARLGAIAIAVNTRFRSAEMADIVGRSGAKLVVFWPAFRHIDFAGIIEDVDSQALSQLVGLVAYDEGGDATARRRIHGLPVYSYRDLSARPEFEPDYAQAQAGCVIFTTSGTTKAPKFVLHRQHSISRHVQDVATRWLLRAPDAMGLSVLPLCGVFGFDTALAALAAGRPQVMMPSFNAAQTREAITRYRVSSTNLTGDMIAQVVDAASGKNDFASVRLCGCGSGASVQVHPAEDKGLTVVGVYGSSEVQALFSRQDETIAADERSLGGGFPSAREALVRAVDTETGALLAHGISGALEIRAPSQLAEYFADPQATRAAFTDDGYFRTGDLGYTLADGRFIYQARMGDAMRLSGFLVSPPQIEGVLLEHGAVLACQVVGVDGEQGTRAYAFVIARAGTAFDEAELLAFCTQRMAKYKVPRRIFRVDEFPTTLSANGIKVQKAKLREMAQALAGEASDKS